MELTGVWGILKKKILPYIIDNMQNILNNMQRNISNFNQQKTKLYWSQVKMSNNIKFWHKDVEAIKHLNNLLDNMLIYTEKIMILVECTFYSSVYSYNKCLEN